MTLSLKFVKQHFEANPDSPIFAYYANLLLQGGDTAGAYQVCSDGLEQYPEFATGWYIFGRIAQERGELEFAKTCWMKALSNDHMALNAATDLLGLEDIELADEEIRTAARLIKEVDSDNVLASTRLEELAARAEPIEEASEETGEPQVDEFSESAEIDAELEEEGASEGDEQEVSSESETTFEHDGVEEEPEEFNEETPEDVPSEQSGGETLRRAFEEALEGHPEFEPPEFEADVDEGASEDSQEEFTPPEFEAEVLEGAEEMSVASEDEPDENESITAEDVLQYSEEDDGLDFNIFDVDRSEIESVMEILRHRLGEDFDKSDVSEETIKQVRDELREKRRKAEEESEESGTEESGTQEESLEEEIEEAGESATAEADIEPEEPVEESPAPQTQSAAFMPEQGSIKITERMATFTFADVLKNQGLYEQAYQVLELMREKSEEPDRIETEQAELRELIEAKRESDRARE